MDIKTISNAAYHREPPNGMTLSEKKLYWSLVLIYTLHHLKALSEEEGRAKKAEIIAAFRADSKADRAYQLMKENPDARCGDILRGLEEGNEID